MPDRMHETLADDAPDDERQPPEGVVTEDHATDEADMLARDRGANAEKVQPEAELRAEEDQEAP